MKRNWFTVASLSSLAALVLYAVAMMWLPQLALDEMSVGVLFVLGASSIVTAILSLHFRDPM